MPHRSDRTLLTRDLSAKPLANSVSPSGFRGGFVDGWNGRISTIDGVGHGHGLGLGVVIP